MPAAPPETPPSVTGAEGAATPALAAAAAAAAGPVGSGPSASPLAVRVACGAPLGSSRAPRPVADNAVITAAAAITTFLELFTPHHHPSIGPSSAQPGSLTPSAGSHPTGSGS